MELLVFLAVLIPILVVARRTYVRQMRAMTPEEREEEKYQEQIW